MSCIDGLKAEQIQELMRPGITQLPPLEEETTLPPKNRKALTGR
jgi:hypothetical protein